MCANDLPKVALGIQIESTITNRKAYALTTAPLSSYITYSNIIIHLINKSTHHIIYDTNKMNNNCKSFGIEDVGD